MTNFLQQSVATHFPVRKRRPRKPWLEPVTFALVEQRQYWRSAASAQGRHLRAAALATHFLVWKLTIFASEQQHGHEQLSRWGAGEWTLLSGPAPELCSTLTSPVLVPLPGQTKRSFINGVANSAARAAEAGSVKGLHVAVRPAQAQASVGITDDPAWGWVSRSVS